MNLNIQNGKNPRKRTIVWLTLFSGIALVSFFIHLISAGGETPKAEESGRAAKSKVVQATPVTVQTPRIEKLQDIVEVTGSLRANQQVTLTPKISERVAKILVEEGDAVKSGQLLVVLEDAQIRTQVAQAEAARNSAQARLEQTKATQKIQDVQIQTRLEHAQADLAAVRANLKQAETQNQLTSVTTDSSVVKAEQDLQTAHAALLQAEAQQTSAKVDLENATERYNRRERLYNRGVISQEELTEAKRTLDVLEAQATIAKHNVAAAQVRVSQAALAVELAKSNTEQRLISQAGVQAAQERARQALSALHAAEAGTDGTIITAEDVKVATAAVEGAEANLAYAREQLRNTEIRAPFSGVIIQRMVNLGQTVSPVAPLVELVALDTVYLDAQVSEIQVFAVHPGMPVRVTVDSLPGQTLDGQVLTVIPVAQEDNRTFRVRIGLPKNAGSAGTSPSLKPGSFGRGQIITREVSNALVVPKAAVVSRDGQDAVFVVSNNSSHAELRRVSLGVTTQNDVEVKSGLSENDRVVVLGAQMLKDGMPVEIRK